MAGFGELGDLGWGWSSITSGLKKAVTAPAKLAYKGTKYATQKTIIDPTKIAAKGALAVGKGTVAVGTNVARGRFKEAAKAAGRTAIAPARTGYETTKHFAKTGVQMSKAVTNVLLYPVRSQLNKLKNRRAALLAYQARGTKVPTTAEKAQARKDTKAMLSKKGTHGKMLAWLAGPDYSYDGLGVVGYDDAALAAIATALTASAIKIIQDAAKSKFAPADAAKAGLTAGGSAALTTATQAIAPEAAAATEAYQAYAKPYQQFVEEAEAYEQMYAPVTQEEVAAEPYVEAQEYADEAETEAFEGMLAGAGLLGGFKEAAPVAAAPEAMPESTARKIAGAAQRLVCQMSAPAIAAIGGSSGLNVVGTFCRALATGDEAGVRATLPAVVIISARAAGDVADQVVNSIPNEGFGCAGGCGLQGISNADLGMLTALGDAEYEGLAFGLAGVSPDDILNASAGGASVLSLLPAGLAVAAGLWLATR